MVKFEDYGLGKPKLASDRVTKAEAFTRSPFDYGTRQRRAYKGYDVGGFSLILPHYLVDDWETFWSNINEGADIFETDAFIFGSGKLGKKVRFIETYRLENLGNLKYRVSARMELIDAGTANTFCYPSNFSYPSDTSYPCNG